MSEPKKKTHGTKVAPPPPKKPKTSEPRIILQTSDIKKSIPKTIPPEIKNIIVENLKSKAIRTLKF